MAIDATTQGFIEAPILSWRLLAFLDFDGDPLRATSSVYQKVISSSGDAELDGTYFSIPSDLIEISPVKHAETGADTVSVSLGGLIGPNTDLLNTIGDKANWQGRIARLWFFVVDEDESQVGEIIPYYTGYMDSVKLSGSPSSQTISLTIENYLATLSGAPNKTYLIQSEYDSGDTSARASIAAANGLVEGVLSGSGGGGGSRGYGPGGSRGVNPRNFQPW